jgi:predicted transcriptional regulator of viral defense system
MPFSDGEIFQLFRARPVGWASRGVIDWLRHRGVPSFFRPDQLADFGLRPHHLPTLIRCGAVERICWGLYHIVGDQPSPHCLLAIVSARSPGSIICLHSALRVHGIHSTPASAATVWLAIEHGARKPPRLRSLPVSLRIVRFCGTAWSFDVTWAKFDAVPARITTPARTVADCFRLERLAGAGAGIAALRDAVTRRLVTLEELTRIETALPCRRLRAVLAAHALIQSANGWPAG